MDYDFDGKVGGAKPEAVSRFGYMNRTCGTIGGIRATGSNVLSTENKENNPTSGNRSDLFYRPESFSLGETASILPDPKLFSIPIK